MALNCNGKSPKAYCTNKNGRRYSTTPFLHFPDHCPIFTGSGECNCYWRDLARDVADKQVRADIMKQRKDEKFTQPCELLTDSERPCFLAVMELEVEAMENAPTCGLPDEPEAPPAAKANGKDNTKPADAATTEATEESAEFDPEEALDALENDLDSLIAETTKKLKSFKRSLGIVRARIKETGAKEAVDDSA